MTDEETVRYLKGETLACDTAMKGWVLLATHGYSIGFGKAGSGQIKNHYPKGLRKMQLFGCEKGQNKKERKIIYAGMVKRRNFL